MQRRRSIPNGNTKNWPSSSTFYRRPKTWSFHVVVLKRRAKKCTKIYNARAQPLFCSLKLLFNAVLVAVVVVVCLSSLLAQHLNGFLPGLRGKLISLAYPKRTARTTLFALDHVTRKRLNETKYGVLETSQRNTFTFFFLVLYTKPQKLYLRKHKIESGVWPRRICEKMKKKLKYIKLDPWQTLTHLRVQQK